jgi:hypothetical protein
MSRLYPERARRGWLGRRKRFGYEINNRGGIRVLHEKYEPPVSDLAKPTPVRAELAGWVLHDGTYIWGGRGSMRRKA